MLLTISICYLYIGWLIGVYGFIQVSSSQKDSQFVGHKLGSTAEATNPLCAPDNNRVVSVVQHQPDLSVSEYIHCSCYLVLKARHAEVKEIQQAVELRH